jgi:hypothetical protein
MRVGCADHQVKDLPEKTVLDLYVEIGTDAALKYELAASIEQHFRNLDRAGLLTTASSPCGRKQESRRGEGARKPS